MSAPTAPIVQPGTDICTMCGRSYRLVPGVDAYGQPTLVVPPHRAPERRSRRRPLPHPVEGAPFYR